MPTFDFAFLADFVRTQGGLAHVIGAGIDTIYAPRVPTGQNVGLLLRLTVTRNECGRPHRIEIIIQDADGQRLVQVDASATPEWVEGQPPGWPVGMLFGLNFGLPLPAYGEYSLEILVNDSSVKSLPFRVVPAENPDQGPPG